MLAIDVIDRAGVRLLPRTNVEAFAFGVSA
jgi:hypothetical protein